MTKQTPLKNSEISVEILKPSGMLKLSAFLNDGSLFSRRYMDMNRKEAIAAFRTDYEKENATIIYPTSRDWMQDS